MSYDFIMNDFNPNKPKAILNASVQILHQKAEKIIEVLGMTYPQYAPLLSFIHASFGIVIAYRQEKLNQFTQYLMDNQETFSGQKMQTREFQEGLEVFLGSYFRQRSDEKLKLAQNIFLDFSKKNELDMPFYPLERYNDTLEKISLAGIQFLGFINTEVPKLQREYTNSQMREHSNTTNTTTMDEWDRIYGMSKSVNFYVEKHIEKEVLKKMKGYEGDKALTEKSRIKDKLREPFSMVSAELEQLGLARGSQQTGVWDGGEYFFNLTHYGEMFTSVIKPEDVYSSNL